MLEMQDELRALHLRCWSISVHPAEYKRSRHEIKKKSSDTIKLQKKARKGNGQHSKGQMMLCKLNQTRSDLLVLAYVL